MSDCYTPTDGEVLEAWAAHNTPDLPTAPDLVGAYDAFKRWLAEHDAKVRAEERAATRQAIVDYQLAKYGVVLPDVDDVLDLLDDRAALIEKGLSNA